jgi:poly-gamma-glutamate synthesis protein (capsule biosynthesis protein)
MVASTILRIGFVVVLLTGISSPAAAASSLPHPNESVTRALVPVTGFTSPRDDVARAELTEVITTMDLVDAVGATLPGARVIGAADPVACVRESGGIALVPPEMVEPSVKTLSFEGRYFWDPALDSRRYPLRIRGTGQTDARRNTWSLVAAGEIIFGRGVQERIEIKHGGDARSAFTEVRDLVRGADLAVATLEAPLSGDHNLWCDSCMRFVGNERYAKSLADAGFDVLSLAANHIGDAGAKGVVDTVAALDRSGIAHAGAGANEAAARRPAVAQVGRVHIAVLGYNDVPPESYAASSTRAGSARLVHDDPTYAALRAEVATAADSAAVVVVLAHWGIEYENAPRSQIVAAAHAMIEAGATVVIGDHPHWVQSVETYRGGYITYGIGNFVFDQMWSMETREGSIQELFFDRTKLVAVRIRPTIIEDYFRPRLLRTDEPAYRATLDRIWERSTFR